MGKATIVQNLGGGRYRVKRNLGTAKRDALLVQFNNQKNEIESNITEQNNKILDQENEITPIAAEYDEANNAVIAFSADLNSKIVNKRSEIDNKNVEKENKESEIKVSKGIISFYNQQILTKQEEFNNKSELKLDIEKFITESQTQKSAAKTNINTLENQIQEINQNVIINRSIITVNFSNLELLLQLNSDQYTDKIVYFIENILDYLDVAKNQAFYFNDETSRYNSIGEYNVESINDSKAGSLAANDVVNAFSNGFTNFALSINQPSDNFLQSLQNAISDLDQAINLFIVESQINLTNKNQIYASSIQVLVNIQTEFNLISNLWQKQKYLSSIYFIPIEIDARIFRFQKEIENIDVDCFIILADILENQSNVFFTDGIDFYNARQTEALQNSQGMPNLFIEQKVFFDDAYDTFNTNANELIAIIDGE